MLAVAEEDHTGILLPIQTEAEEQAEAAMLLLNRHRVVGQVVQADQITLEAAEAVAQVIYQQVGYQEVLVDPE
jgi:hypothetical protein